jgi:2,4-dienoyl-CoA reductase-like NADH-dependent reductase (Old Yellow Enzyme family)
MAGDDGGVTPKLIDTMRALAEGGAGLIISSHAYVSPEGKAGPGQIGAYQDGLVPGLSELTKAVHEGGGKIVMQIAHAGNFAAEKLVDQPPLAVSLFDGLAKSPRREMTSSDIRSLVAAFASAARRARDAGFDGVQMHSAHGYLLNQFLSPFFNRRQDEYGGDINHRARVHLEIYRAIRDAVGDDYPVLIKLNGQDFADIGLEREDSLKAAQMLAREGLNAIELSGGLLFNRKSLPSRMGIKTEEKEAYFREDGRVFKEALDIPLILVGGIRSFEVAERMVETGVADYISMSRPFIREPDLINRWKSGDRSKAECKSDNLCFKTGLEGNGIYCPTRQRELEN